MYSLYYVISIYLKRDVDLYDVRIMRIRLYFDIRIAQMVNLRVALFFILDYDFNYFYNDVT